MRQDPHSYADLAQARTARVELDLRADFAARTLRGEAVLRFAAPAAGALDLDTRGLEVESVSSLDGQALPHALHPPEPILGARLSLELPPASLGVRVRYATSEEASALQWLSPAQTAGGAHPFLYSQCQPIHARSVAPLQDTPRARIEVGATFAVPAPLRALMGARLLRRAELPGAMTSFSFELPQPIPPYLLAFAVGSLEERALSWLNEGLTVFAERRIVEALFGRERAELEAAAGRHELEGALRRFRDRPELTRLRTDLSGVDPDLAFSAVPYEKGYLFLAGWRSWPAARPSDGSCAPTWGATASRASGPTSSSPRSRRSCRGLRCGRTPPPGSTAPGCLRTRRSRSRRGCLRCGSLRARRGAGRCLGPPRRPSWPRGPRSSWSSSRPWATRRRGRPPPRPAPRSTGSSPCARAAASSCAPPTRCARCARSCLSPPRTRRGWCARRGG